MLQEECGAKLDVNLNTFILLLLDGLQTRISDGELTNTDLESNFWLSCPFNREK